MSKMKIWIDDVRPAPLGWEWAKTVNEAKGLISKYRFGRIDIEVISLDHDAGDYAYDGGDYIKVLDWLEEMGWNYPIHIHSMNIVGRMNMKRIVERNGWTEVKDIV